MRALARFAGVLLALVQPLVVMAASSVEAAGDPGLLHRTSEEARLQAGDGVSRHSTDLLIARSSAPDAGTRSLMSLWLPPIVIIWVPIGGGVSSTNAGGGTVVDETTFPSFLQGLSDQSTVSGTPLVLGVEVGGGGPYRYEWRRILAGAGASELLGVITTNAPSSQLEISPFTSAAAGEYSVTVSNGAGEVSSSARVSVTPRPQGISISGPSAPHFGDPPFPLTVTTESGLPAEITVQGAAVWDPVRRELTYTQVGPCTVTAWQAGDADFSPSATAVLPLNVGKGLQSVRSFAALPNVQYGAPPIRLVAELSSALTPTFTVTGPATVSGNILTLTGAGTVTVTAGHPGNENYEAAAGIPQSFLVSPAAEAVVLDGPTRFFLAEGTASLVARSTSGRPPILSVEGPATLESGSRLRFLGVGTVRVVGTLPENQQFSAATASFTFDILADPQVYLGLGRDPANSAVVRVVFRGAPRGTPFQLQRSADLIEWRDWQVVSIGDDGQVISLDSTMAPRQFYRARWVR